jgi:hypothetical protein
MAQFSSQCEDKNGDFTCKDHIHEANTSGWHKKQCTVLEVWDEIFTYIFHDDYIFSRMMTWKCWTILFGRLDLMFGCYWHLYVIYNAEICIETCGDWQIEKHIIIL